MKSKFQYMLVLNKGENLINSIIDHAKKLNIKSAYFSGIGALENPTLGFFDVKTKKYKQQNFSGFFELVSLIGNITTCEGQYIVHAHAALSDAEYKVIGGHLFEATIGLAAEITIFTFDKIIQRKLNPDFGLNLIS